MFRKSSLFMLSTLAVLSAPVFASGLGPAPHYDPRLGAPASQRGPSAQTLAAEAQQSALTVNAVGGTTNVTSEAGRPNTQPHDAKVQDNQ
ncbi:hypothetical protein NE850_36375 [Paraburkholderia sp. USG1]|uniref:hypothetical protein n=1 Tax=Paraburkholderia sp. USG1 TaxID=2952268 RepID=UPI00285B8CD5|nr:hypothetical protein [Paraburkholderia sp. USG1]MDR8401812.1 hypothetical protein [Paraburkholderia sp. USG1]